MMYWQFTYSPNQLYKFHKVGKFKDVYLGINCSASLASTSLKLTDMQETTSGKRGECVLQSLMSTHNWCILKHSLPVLAVLRHHHILFVYDQLKRQVSRDTISANCVAWWYIHMLIHEVWRLAMFEWAINRSILQNTRRIIPSIIIITIIMIIIVPKRQVQVEMERLTW